MSRIKKFIMVLIIISTVSVNPVAKSDVSKNVQKILEKNSSLGLDKFPIGTKFIFLLFVFVKKSFLCVMFHFDTIKSLNANFWHTFVLLSPFLIIA